MASSGDIKAGGASVRISVDEAPLVQGLKNAEARLKAFGQSAAMLGAKLGAIGLSLGAGLVGAAKQFADTGGMLDDLSQRTGDTVENLSAIGYAAKQSGSGLGELEGGLSKMSGVIAGAIAGEKASIKLLNDLGLSAGKLKGKLPTEQLEIFADKISQVTDTDTKNDMVKAIFGKSGTMLIPLLNEGSAGIEKLKARAKELGLVMSSEDAAGAAAFGDALDNLYDSLGGVVSKIGGAVAPILTSLADQITNVVASVSKFVSENKRLVIGVGIGATGLIALGAAISGIGLVSYVAGAAVGVLSGAIGVGYAIACGVATTATAIYNAGVVAMAVVSNISAIATGLLTSAMATLGATVAVLTSPLTLSVAAIAAVGAAAIHAMGGFTAFGQAMRSSLAGASALFSGLAATAKETFGGIADAVASGNIQGAIDILWAGVKVAWQQGADAVKATWDAAMIYVRGALDSTVNGLGGIWAGFQTAFTIGITTIEGAFDTAVSYIKGAWASGMAILSAGLDKFITFSTKSLAEIGFKARELKVAISPIFGKAAAYENINNDRQKLAKKLEDEAAKRAKDRQTGIDTAFDSKGLEKRSQLRNNRVAASGDTRAADAEFRKRQEERQKELEGLGKSSEKLAQLKEELAGLVAKASESTLPPGDKIKEGQKAADEASKVASEMKSPAAAVRGSAEAASAAVRAVGGRSDPQLEQLKKSNENLKAIGKAIKDGNKNKVTFKEKT